MVYTAEAAVGASYVVISLSICQKNKTKFDLIASKTCCSKNYIPVFGHILDILAHEGTGEVVNRLAGAQLVRLLEAEPDFIIGDQVLVPGHIRSEEVGILAAQRFPDPGDDGADEVPEQHLAHGLADAAAAPDGLGAVVCHEMHQLHRGICTGHPGNMGVGLHRTVQLQLLQCYWLGHRLGLLCSATGQS